MSCVQSVHYQICINGELTETFVPKNGIRQGDPLSLYLVVWKPMKSSQSGPVVSHLFFADDLVLFAETSPQQAKIMKDYLKVFCQALGQAVNFDKFAIFCSPNTCKDTAQEISNILWFALN
ncbi:unnamed protein product [Prunus armeniaca]